MNVNGWNAVIFSCLLLRQGEGRVGTMTPQRNARSLFKSKEKAEPTFCSPKGKPNFDDGDFSLFAFDKKFDPKCSCVDENNTLDLISKLEETVGAPDFVEVFHRAIGDFRAEKSYECVNACEVCLESDDEDDEDAEICGILETAVDYKFKSAKKNEKFELKEVLSGSVMDSLDPKTMLTKPDYSVEVCIKYTKGHEGRLCFGADLKASKNEKQSCFVGHDGKSCTSCERKQVDGKHCLVADCSNIGGSEELDTCSGEGLTGAFAIMDTFFNNPEPKFKAGASCGDYAAMHGFKN